MIPVQVFKPKLNLDPEQQEDIDLYRMYTVKLIQFKN